MSSNTGSASEVPDGTPPWKSGAAPNVPHTPSMVVWDAPSPVVIARPFLVKVGVRCSAGCRLAGRTVEVLDEGGAIVGTGTLGLAPWTGTDALYWAAISVRGPISAGPGFWTARAPAASSDPRHGAAAAAFGFRADRTPEHRVTITVTQRDTGTPVASVEVRLGVYVRTTDERGVATAELPAGAYALTIRKDGFAADPVTLDVLDDMAVDVVASTVSTRADREASGAFEHVRWS